MLNSLNKHNTFLKVYFIDQNQSIPTKTNNLIKFINLLVLVGIV